MLLGQSEVSWACTREKKVGGGGRGSKPSRADHRMGRCDAKLGHELDHACAKRGKGERPSWAASGARLERWKEKSFKRKTLFIF